MPTGVKSSRNLRRIGVPLLVAVVIALVVAWYWKSHGAPAADSGYRTAPVERGDPIEEFYAATVRRSRDGFADSSWHRESRVTREEALVMLTRAPAFAAFQEKDRGSIEVGKQADFTVLSADVMTVPEDRILDTRVVMTIIAGEVAFAR
jgi:hypothetical protein